MIGNHVTSVPMHITSLSFLEELEIGDHVISVPLALSAMTSLTGLVFMGACGGTFTLQTSRLTGLRQLRNFDAMCWQKVEIFGALDELKCALPQLVYLHLRSKETGTISLS